MLHKCEQQLDHFCLSLKEMDASSIKGNAGIALCLYIFLPFYVCTTLTDMTCSFWLVVENRAEIFISRGEGGRLWYWLWDTVLFFFARGILGGVLQQIN